MLVLGLQAILADECFHRLFATFCLHGYYRCLYKMSLGEDKGKKNYTLLELSLVLCSG